MTPEERKRHEDRLRERKRIKNYAPLEALEKIAKDHIPGLYGRPNGLDTMFSDGEDFVDVAVWSIKEALIEAYMLGKKDGWKEKNK